MSSMLAGVASADGLRMAQVPIPSPAADQVLVRVRAAGLNRADLLAATGAYAGPNAGAGAPIGMEWAGEIVEAGSDVRGFKAGDRVACSGMGGYAQYALADPGRCIPLSGGDFTHAAILPMVLMTAHDAVVTQGRLSPGEAVLVQGASSAVGLAAMQIARLLGAGVVIGTSTNRARREQLARFGADLAVDPGVEGWAERVRAETGGKGVDLTIDMVSGAGLGQVMAASAVLGRIVNVGRLGGGKVEFDLNEHALKRLTYIGVTFRTRSPAEVREIVERMRADVWDQALAGAISLPVQTFPLSDAIAAQDCMKANRHFGKLALIP